MKKTTIFLRLVASLCLIAGLSAFAVACGDDDGGGSDCASGEVFASGPGIDDGCYQTCESNSDCDAAGATCDPTGDGADDVSICVGGEDNNSTPDGGGPDGGEPDGSGLECSADEVPANPFGEGEACYSTCDTIDDCSGAEECAELSDGTSICVEFPSGSLSCSEIIACQGQCAEGDNACFQNCTFEGTEEAQGTFQSVVTCSNENCDANSPSGCLRNNCQAQVDACAGCTADEIELNFECALPCENDGECETGEECVEAHLGLLDGQSVCSYQPENLSGPCTGDGDCGAPDPDVVAQGDGICNTNATPNSCFALGCNASSQYGPSTGCGLEGICFEQSSAQGTVTFCQALCSEQVDCAGNETGDFSCRIVQVTNGKRTGICGSSCAEDSECAFTGADGSDIAGQCNHLGYCELPCDGDGSCAQAGGTCDANDFCVFDEQGGGGDAGTGDAGTADGGTADGGTADGGTADAGTSG